MSFCDKLLVDFLENDDVLGFVVEALCFDSCDAGEDFFWVSGVVGWKGDERSGDFIGLDGFSSGFYLAKADPAYSASTGEGDIDAVHGGHFLEVFIVFGGKGSDFFSCGVFDEYGDSHGGRKKDKDTRF